MSRLLILIFIFFTHIGLTQEIEEKSKKQEMNAKIFLAQIKAASDSGGAGNGGGNEIIAEFFEQALIALEIAKFSKVISEKDYLKIKNIFSKTRIFTVEFQLCFDDSRTDCKPGYASKNYPEENIILIDSRDKKDRWIQMTSLKKKKHSFHEILGLAGIEVANHLLSTQINSIDIFNSYKTSKDIKRYFKILNDLYFMLPKSTPKEFIGNWGKKTIVRPRKAIFRDDAKSLSSGEKLVVKINLNYNDQNKDFNTDSVVPVWVEEYTHEYEINMWGEVTAHIKEGFCFRGQINQGVFECQWDGDEKYHPKWKKKVKKYFKPTFPVNMDGQKISPFSCKMIDENKLICRHIHYSGPFDSRVLEYAFFDRIKIKE